MPQDMRCFSTNELLDIKDRLEWLEVLIRDIDIKYDIKENDYDEMVKIYGIITQLINELIT